jgi:hypothetical protein
LWAALLLEVMRAVPCEAEEEEADEEANACGSKDSAAVDGAGRYDDCLHNPHNTVRKIYQPKINIMIQTQIEPRLRK